jgi:hypothetical protein
MTNGITGNHARLRHTEPQSMLYIVWGIRSSVEVVERDIVEVIGVVSGLGQEGVDEVTESSSVSALVCGLGAGAQSNTQVDGERAPDLDHLWVELHIRCEKAQDGEDGDQMEKSDTDNNH